MVDDTHDSMDLLADAIFEQKSGSKEKFFFIIQKNIKHEHNLKRYYAEPFPASNLENKLFSFCKGDILDIGSATGNYFKKLMKKGNVIGVEQNKKLIALAKKNNINNIKLASILSYKTTKKFDVITLLENNVGLGGNLSKTIKLIRILLNLLNKDGKIFAIVSKRAKKDYYIVKLKSQWKQKIGKPVNWLNINPNFLTKICTQNRARLEILAEDNKNYLIKINHI